MKSFVALDARTKVGARRNRREKRVARCHRTGGGKGWETTRRHGCACVWWSAIFSELRNVFMSLRAASSADGPFVSLAIFGDFVITLALMLNPCHILARKLIRIVNTLQKTGLKEIKIWMIPKGSANVFLCRVASRARALGNEREERAKKLFPILDWRVLRSVRKMEQS